MRDAKPKEVIRMFNKLGAETMSGGNGHTKVRFNGAAFTVPAHGTIKRNTLEAIRKQAGIEKKEFYAKL